VIDISCDVGKPNNPISIYEKETTWETPVYHHPSNIDIISISNLPSLLPEESSEYFSEKLYTLLMNPYHVGWTRSLNAYLSKIISKNKNDFAEEFES
jgi:alanine dehydrogenase